MNIHPEGKSLVYICFALCILALCGFGLGNTFGLILLIPLIILLCFIIHFFRNPQRNIPKLDNHIVYAPADGKIVVIEEVLEPEVFGDKRLQISIFMSPMNVHVNRAAIGGEVTHSTYHPGKYLVAWHPKSSTENERHTTVIRNGEHRILIRQIAGAVARRIVNYLSPGDEVKQGQDIGFIKFGSRVDIFLPLSAGVEVKHDQLVKGNLSPIARL